jgi:hypothetical protein
MTRVSCEKTGIAISYGTAALYRLLSGIVLDPQKNADGNMVSTAAKHFEDNVHKVAFEVSFAREGGRENMQWTGGQGGPGVVMNKEPYATTMQKLTVGIVKWLPIVDSQL